MRWTIKVFTTCINITYFVTYFLNVYFGKNISSKTLHDHGHDTANIKYLSALHARVIIHNSYSRHTQIVRPIRWSGPPTFARSNPGDPTLCSGDNCSCDNCSDEGDNCSAIGIEPTTSWLLDRRHTTRPPRLPDDYGWFDSHTFIAAGTALSWFIN